MQTFWRGWVVTGFGYIFSIKWQTLTLYIRIPQEICIKWKSLKYISNIINPNKYTRHPRQKVCMVSSHVRSNQTNSFFLSIIYVFGTSLQKWRFFVKILKKLISVISMFTLQNHIQSHDFRTGSYGVGHEAYSGPIKSLCSLSKMMSFLRNTEKNVNSILDVYPPNIGRMTKSRIPAGSKFQRASFLFLIRFSA